MILILLERIASLFLIVVCGYFLVKKGLVDYKSSRVLSVISIYLITPAVIIHSFQIDYSPAIRDNFLLSIFAAILIHALIMLVTEVLKRLFNYNVVEQASMIYTNAANLIIPLIVSLFGQEWVIYSSAFIMVQLFIFWTHGLSLFSGKNQFDLKSFLTNINLVSIFIGASFFFLRIKLPTFLNGALASLSATIGPVAMILLGMIIAGSHYGRKYWNLRTLFYVFTKMLFLPLLLTLALKCLDSFQILKDSSTILTISLLAAVAPSGVAIIQMAQLYNRDVEEASLINLLTTMSSIITLPMMVWIFTL
ncbi:AEC family transporter [Streptococcus oricebi]|uniref:Autotransporter n=1 Tax=Streptococcus oricebi TaxID=1547447 RepID=A0ABS5B4R4_9STRE|nr:AEC family transporter [Streptococcus oricebi]MBP2623676.1 autotransporter [Streptococcus oricebi]